VRFPLAFVGLPDAVTGAEQPREDTVRNRDFYLIDDMDWKPFAGPTDRRLEG
jgi:hypothetical protein